MFSTQSTSDSSTILWREPKEITEPMLSVPVEKSTKISRASNELDIFLQVMPMSFFMFIAYCTNVRLHKLCQIKKSAIIPNTDCWDCMMSSSVMCAWVCSALINADLATAVAKMSIANQCG